ncbi:MAG: 3'(2'),5'-bisphosphate nucleotidase [Coxiella sp. RIFCSPHIGHO2_12_FULL_44_14]|nr:MAG: 3'(2'),5'-bisphosphate nucleotidase [Coxiella sp. RIFCSPHIGHO2_12_FULL_44_14]
MSRVGLEVIQQIAREVGEILRNVYQSGSYDVVLKSDQSPLTRADQLAHQHIVMQLTKYYPDIPILSEENADAWSYSERQQWRNFWLVDPLDGTREFIDKNDQFTVNIALIEKNQPILGVIYVPMSDVLYYAEKNQGAYKEVKSRVETLRKSEKPSDKLRVAVSRSHAKTTISKPMLQWIKDGRDIEYVPVGSSLKFGLVAEGTVEMYVRLGPTMEWDTAAGHILVEEAGFFIQTKAGALTYNKPSLLNAPFIVCSQTTEDYTLLFGGGSE